MNSNKNYYYKIFKLFFLVLFFFIFSSFFEKNFATDGKITEIEVKDRERMLQRLKSIRFKRPDDYLTTYKIGNLYFSLQMEDEAIKEYRRCLKLKPDFPAAKWFLIQVLISKGYLDEPFKLTRELIEKDPLNYKYYDLAGNILVKLDQREVAKEYFKRSDELFFPKKATN
ncbi:MAG: hypothetical protein HQM08_08415 [Candidatus Riflebacteria bacterium]|nr:hypothetical protein [Candidatus Riflebacteria bacterium]